MISLIKIKNFRSIKSVEISTQNLNIFVGKNDEGKSNILRALDLFFNGHNDGYVFDWNQDFNCYSEKKVKKADEIIIELEITLPYTFTTKTPIIWKKIWRKEGFFVEEIKLNDGKEIPQKQKITPFLKAIRFDYVPAIKGKEYFNKLMIKMHDMLEATVEKEVRDASKTFTDKINENTQLILSDILRRLNLLSKIQLPPNLRDLFSQLEFTSVTGEKQFSFNQRGDGIKVRHIPIVLRWLAEQANHLSDHGRPKTMTIWGYEEPENNLELLKCYDLAKEILEGSSKIQTFMTTHSPVFYSVFKNSTNRKVNIYSVVKDDNQSTNIHIVRSTDDYRNLDTSMGLFELLSPHFKELEIKNEKLLKELEEQNLPTIFCEGPSDKLIFDECIILYYKNHKNKVVVKCAEQHGGGYNWVKDKLISWSYSRSNCKAVGIFDKDREAIRIKRETSDGIRKSKISNAFAEELIPNNELKKCFKNDISIPYSLEELYLEEIWDYASSKGYLEPRTDVIDICKFKDLDIPCSEFIKSKKLGPNIERMIKYKIKLENKVALAKYITKTKDINKKKAYLLPFKDTLEKCFAKLEID